MTKLRTLTKSLMMQAAALVIASTGVTTSRAQILQASRSHYSTENGLTSNAVSDICQDDYGYIWIATWNGLSRFDGFDFYNYPTGYRSGIPQFHNRIMDICTDQSQNIWMRMYDGRIFVLNRSTDRIENALQNTAGYQDMKTTQKLTVTRNGDIMAIMKNDGIYRMRLDKNGMKTSLTNTRGLEATAIVEGYHGDIWVGTEKGIHRMNPNDETIDSKGIFENEHITCMYSNGYNIYAGTQSGKIVSFAYGQTPRIVHEAGSEIRTIFVDSRGLLWFATARPGVARMNMETGDIKVFTQKVLVPAHDSNVSEVTEVAQILWANMTNGGFGYYNRETDEMEFFHNDPSNTWNLSNTVMSYLALPEGVVWESTSRKGLEKLEILKKTIIRKKFFPENSTTNSNEIRAMYYDEPNRRLLIGNKLGMLQIIRDRDTTTITDDGQGSTLGRIYGIGKDSRGNYWLSSKGKGLIRLEPAAGGYRKTVYSHNPKDPMSLSSNDAYCTVEDKYGNIWVATYSGGVNIMTRSKEGRTVFLHSRNVIRHYPRGAYNKVRTLVADHAGNVWAGTTDGLLVMSYRNNRIKIQTVADTENGEHNLMSKDIVALACDNKGSVWIGTNGGGLSHTTGRDKQGNWKFETFGCDDGLPSEEIKSITFDKKGKVWFATDNVLCSFETEKRIFSTFSTLDGVDNTICSEGAAIRLPEANIMFGTLDGCYVVDRKKLRNNNGSMLKLRLTDFFLDDELMSPRLNGTFSQYVPESKEVELPEAGSTFALRFASLNYQLQHRVHYQYMLEGHDKEWLNADRTRTAVYTDVPAGRYTFKVKAFLLEAPDKYDMRTIDIVVPNHFLLSSDAIWLYMALAVAAMLGVMFWRQKKLAMQAKPQSEKTVTETEE